MKKNLGNKIVKKSIIVAMSVMLISASPALRITAAEDNAITTTVDDTAAQADDAAQDTTTDDMTAAEDELVKKLDQGLQEIGKKFEQPIDEYSPYDGVDDAHELVHDEVDNAIKNEVSDADQAANEAETAADNAVELDANIKEYEDVTDELLRKDQEIVSSEEGNTDNIVETIKENGNIMINVEDENGDKTQVKVEDYTKEKADIATSAVQDAQDSLNNVLNSGANIEEERAKVNEALATATAAKDEAETAYNAAQSVLIDEIKRYNAYAEKYGLALYEYTNEKGEKSTPVYTEDELAGLSDLTMDKAAIENGLDELSKNDLSEQLKEIQDAEKMVADCGTGVVIANEAITNIKSMENNLVNGLQNMMAGAEEAMKTATGVQKDIYQAMYETAKGILEEYTKPLDEVDRPNASYKDSFDYAMDSSSMLADEVQEMVDNANDELYGTEENEGAVTRYYNALEKYNAIKAEYDNYLANKDTINKNFTALEEKLKNAEASLDDAYTNLVIAIDAVNTAQKIKDEFDNMSNNNGGDSNSDSGSDSTDNTTASATPAPAVLTIDDVLTPLTDTITDEPVPLTDAIIDEQVPLIDSVPKTGDSASAAGAVGATGVITMLGALFLNLKKKTLR